jgi:hypothetical protein
MSASGSRVSRIAMVASLCVVAACATRPRFPQYAGADAACIEGTIAGMFSYAAGEAMVHLREIDATPAQGRSCVMPGKHRAKFLALREANETIQDIDLDFRAGRIYKLRAHYKGDTFLFRLIDITNGQETELAAFEVAVQKRGSIIDYMPAYVPAIKVK